MKLVEIVVLIYFCWVYFGDVSCSDTVTSWPCFVRRRCRMIFNIVGRKNRVLISSFLVIFLLFWLSLWTSSHGKLLCLFFTVSFSHTIAICLMCISDYHQYKCCLFSSHIILVCPQQDYRIIQLLAGLFSNSFTVPWTIYSPF